MASVAAQAVLRSRLAAGRVRGLGLLEVWSAEVKGLPVYACLAGLIMLLTGVLWLEILLVVFLIFVGRLFEHEFRQRRRGSRAVIKEALRSRRR